MKYGIVIKWSEEDGEYIATCPSFPGLLAFGSTLVEAAAEASIAINLFVEQYQTAGQRLPKARLFNRKGGKIKGDGGFLIPA